MQQDQNSGKGIDFFEVTRERYALLTGQAISNKKLQKFERMRTALNIAPDNGIWSALIALDWYADEYQKIHADIKNERQKFMAEAKKAIGDFDTLKKQKIQQQAHQLLESISDAILYKYGVACAENEYRLDRLESRATACMWAGMGLAIFGASLFLCSSPVFGFLLQRLGI